MCLYYLKEITFYTSIRAKRRLHCPSTKECHNSFTSRSPKSDHRLAPGSFCSTSGSQPPSFIVGNKPNGAWCCTVSRCSGAELTRADSVSSDVPLSASLTPRANALPFLRLELLPRSKRSDRVDKKRRALSAPERLYMKITTKVATAGIAFVFVPKPLIQRTILRGRTRIQYTMG